MNTPISQPIIIVKSLGFAMGRIVITGSRDGSGIRKISHISFAEPPCMEENAALPANGLWLGADAFEGLCALVDEARAALVEAALTKP